MFDTTPGTCMLLCLVAVGHSTAQLLEITSFSVPSALRVGETAELQCQHSASPSEEPRVYVKWWRTRRGEREQLYQRLHGHVATPAHLNIRTHIKQQDTIEIVNMQPSDSGIYECEVSDIVDERRRHHELVVYTQGTGPQLNMSSAADFEHVLVECEAAGVAPKPYLNITIDGEEDVHEPGFVIEAKNGVYDIFANLTVRREVLAGKMVNCELFYENEHVSHEPFVTSMTYQDLGAELPTTAGPEATTERNTTTESIPPSSGSSSVLRRPWVLMLALALPALLL